MNIEVNKKYLNDSKKKLFSNANTEIYEVRLASLGHTKAILKKSTTSNSERSVHKKASELSDHIVKYIDSYIQKGKTYLLMENCSNGTLENLMSQRKLIARYWSTDILKDYMRPLLNALKSLHSAQITHRDIKPANIFVNADYECKLGDFGISSITTERGS